MNKYLQDLKIQKGPRGGTPKTGETQPKVGADLPCAREDIGFGGFGGSTHRRFSGFEGPALDVYGDPCGLCPRCGQGEYWRRSKKYYPDVFDERSWACMRCNPPPKGEEHYCDWGRVPTPREARGNQPLPAPKET
jgi:hypothetical protein